MIPLPPIIPGTCMACGTPIPADRQLCSACLANLPPAWFDPYSTQLPEIP
ncbi:MAG: double zinc ribbon domain-containing protein [bacterium]